MTREDFWLLLWGDEGRRHEVHLRDDDGPVCCWIPCHHKARLIRLLDAEDCYVSAVPRERLFDQRSRVPGDAHMLWVSLSKPDSCLRLQRFSPAPTLVWREGSSSRRWAAWSLSQPLAPAWVKRAGERLAHRLGGLRRAAMAHTMLPSPFSGKWAIEYGQAETFTARQIVGHLPDAPDLRQWRAAA